VVAARMPYAGHIFEIFKFPGFEVFFRFVCHGYGAVWSALLVLPIVLFILPVRILSVILVWESFSCSFFCYNCLLHYTLEFFIVPWVLFAEVVELPLGQYPVRESFNNFLLSDVVLLCM
jgi:hypothetical protein